MASSGPNTTVAHSALASSSSASTSSAKYQTSIYAKMEHQVSLKKISDELSKRLRSGEAISQLWILRESNKPGCLTQDEVTIEKDKVLRTCHRYALIKSDIEGKEPSWVNVSNEELLNEYIKADKVIYMNKDLAFKEERIKYCHLLFDQFEQDGYSAKSYLEPSKKEQTRNSMYDVCSACGYMDFKAELEQITAEVLNDKLKEVISEIEAKEDCPIDLEPLMSADSVGILPSGHAFRKDAITQWVKENKSNPLTRERVGLRDILESHVGQKTRECIASLSKRLRTT